MFYLDHYLSFISTSELDAHLEEYRSLGFDPVSHTVRHDPGLHNGFVRIGVDYLEFLWVEDEETFEKQADDHMKQTREAQSMRAIGIVVDDIEQARADWLDRDFEVSEVSYRRPRDAEPDSEPRWAFLSPPPEDYGVHLFCLSYLQRSSPSEVHIQENGIFGIAGITMVCEDVDDKISTWMDVFNLSTPVDQVLEMGPHFIRWLTPAEFKSKYGMTKSTASGSTDLSLLHLLCEDLSTTRSYFDNHKVVETDEGILVRPSDDDGFVFAITEEDQQTWVKTVETIRNEVITVTRA